MAFVAGPGAPPSLTHQRGRRVTCERRQRAAVMCRAREEGDGLQSPGAAVRAWEAARSAAHAMDLGRRFVHVLFVSDECHRAVIAERMFAQLAERRSRARRLLVHSAGIDAAPGAEVPRDILAAAARRGLNLADSHQCARFDPHDFECYDFILALDQAVLHRVARIAAAAAHVSGGPLADWERKIHLAADFNGARATRGDQRAGFGSAADIRKFHAGELDPVMDDIENACKQVLATLIVAGL